MKKYVDLVLWNFLFIKLHEWKGKDCFILKEKEMKKSRRIWRHPVICIEINVPSSSAFNECNKLHIAKIHRQNENVRGGVIYYELYHDFFAYTRLSFN